MISEQHKCKNCNKDIWTKAVPYTERFFGLIFCPYCLVAHLKIKFKCKSPIILKLWRM